MKKISLKIKTVPVVLEKPDGGNDNLELREMTAGQRDKYLDMLGERVRIDAQGKPAGIKKFDGMRSELLSLCLYRDGVLVKKEEIQNWSSTVTEELYKEAQILNNLAEDTDAIKKEAEIKKD